MLKTYQVLLPDWLEDHVKYIAKTYDLSFSEVIRGEICFATLVAVTYLHPEYKPEMKLEEIMALTRDYDKDKMKIEDLHRYLSKLYFETRKAIEYWMKKGESEKKK